MHSPMSNIPILRHFFEYHTEQPGNKRTPNVAVMFENSPSHLEYKVLAGSTFRMVNDLAYEGQVQLVTDVGSEMSSIFSSNRLSINKEWMAGRYIRLPTSEMEDQIRYKMLKTAPVVFLFPDENGVIVEEKKHGCPFAGVLNLEGLEKPHP